MLKLYADPSSTTCRPILLYAADRGIDLDIAWVDLLSGEHLSEAFAGINPNRLVPVLDHDGFCLTESSAILKYLADLVGSCAYPAEPQARARTNQWMDWFVTLFSQDFNYGVIYSRILPGYALAEPGETERRGWPMARAQARFSVLEANLRETGAFLCGPAITIADYLGVCFVTLAELVDFDLSAYPNICRWVAAMKARPSWDETHAAFYGWRGAIQACARGVA
jgi:glutathione S-transferase